MTDGTVHSLAAIISAICQAQGQPPPRLYLPVAPVRWAAALVAAGYGLLHRPPPVSPATVAKYLEEMAVDGSRLARELGFEPRYSLRAGWQQVAAARRPPASP